MIIRDERPEDADAIRAVVEEAFGQPDEADLVEALRSFGNVALSLVAEDDQEIKGHILFSVLQSPEKCVALAPVSVLPAWQKQGIGSALILEGLAKAGRGGWRCVFVLGEPEFYRRFGFSVNAAEPFSTVFPKEYFMALELQPGALDACARTVEYAPQFSEL